jgi:alpha-L-fucosidase
LFTRYGEVHIFITDGWDAPWSRITYEEVPFDEIYEHIKNLQPDCLICDLNASQYRPSGLYYSDVKAFEQNAGQKVPEGSDVPALPCATLTEGWFWKQRDASGRLAADLPLPSLPPMDRSGCSGQRLVLTMPSLSSWASAHQGI